VNNKEKLALVNTLYHDKDVWMEIDADYVLVDSTDKKVRDVFDQLGVDVDEYYHENGSFMDSKDTSMCIVRLANECGAIAWWDGRGFMDYMYSEDDETITIDAERFRNMERVVEATIVYLYNKNLDDIEPFARLCEAIEGLEAGV
jgi:hypothetical protein